MLGAGLVVPWCCCGSSEIERRRRAVPFPTFIRNRSPIPESDSGVRFRSPISDMTDRAAPVHRPCSPTRHDAEMIDDDHFETWPRERQPVHDTRVIVAIHGARDAVSRRLAITTREHGLDPIESLVLGALLREPSCPPWLLRQRLGLHRSTLSSILDRLEHDGRIQRRKSSFDGRRFEILLTRAGTISADIAELIVRDVEAEIAGYTSPAQRHGAVAVFEACVAIGRRDRGSFD